MLYNNFVDDVLEEKWGDVELRFFEIRKDFIILILKFIDMNVISYIEIFFVFWENILFVLEDMEKFKVYRDIRRFVFDVFFIIFFRMSLLYLN